MPSWIEVAAITGLLVCAAGIGARGAEGDGKQDYLQNCARCHGADGKGSVPAMRETRGYVGVDLTTLSRNHDGHFPREQVYEIIDGRERFPAHLVGDMPAWGLEFQAGSQTRPEDEKRIRLRIERLVDYIGSLQLP